MIKQPTTFILGAGASKPYGFPLGIELVDRVCTALAAEDSELRRVLVLLGFKEDHIEQFASQLQSSRVDSIDQFLVRRSEYRELGKAVIAGALIPCERESALFDANPNEDWYRYLFNQLGDSLDQVQENKLSIVTFNFDRSFERALFLTLRNSYGATPEVARGICARIPVIHIHGQLGVADWLQPNVENARPYHPSSSIPTDNRAAVPLELDPEDVKRCTESIRLFNEAASDDVTKQALDVLTGSRRVCFLGFGYHPENIAKLQPEQWWSRFDVHSGTVYKLEGGEISSIIRRFPNNPLKFNPNPGLDCRGFLRHTDYLSD
jgi:hypothetical protein